MRIFVLKESNGSWMRIICTLHAKALLNRAEKKTKQSNNSFRNPGKVIEIGHNCGTCSSI